MEFLWAKKGDGDFLSLQEEVMYDVSRNVSAQPKIHAVTTMPIPSKEMTNVMGKISRLQKSIHMMKSRFIKSSNEGYILRFQ